jgi:drug/metabolite transporter (DMT)-like permease
MTETIETLFRFAHVAGAAIGVGGLVITAAAASKLPEEARPILIRQAGKWIGIGLTVCILSGLYNGFVQYAAHSSSTYHTVLAIKAAVGLLVFLFSLFVFHPAPAFRSFAERRGTWIGFLIAGALLAVALGAYLHGIHDM